MALSQHQLSIKPTSLVSDVCLDTMQTLDLAAR